MVAPVSKTGPLGTGSLGTGPLKKPAEAVKEATPAEATPDQAALATDTYRADATATATPDAVDQAGEADAFSDAEMDSLFDGLTDVRPTSVEATATVPAAPPTPEVAEALKQAAEARAAGDDYGAEMALQDAAIAAKNGADVQAVLDAAKAAGGDPAKTLDYMTVLQANRLPAEKPDPGMMEALAGQWDAQGNPAKAAAIRTAMGPGVSDNARKVALQLAAGGGLLTPQYFPGLLADQQAPADIAAVQAALKAGLPADQADEMIAADEINRAQETFDDAAKALGPLNEGLATAMNHMAGRSEAEKKAFVEAYKAKHPEYAAYEQAQQGLVAAVKDNQTAAAAALGKHDSAPGVNSQVFEKAMATLADVPAATEVVTALATSVVQHAQDVPRDRLDAVMALAPKLASAQVETAMAEKGLKPEEALAAFADSPLGVALSTASSGTAFASQAKGFMEDLGTLKAALGRGDEGAVLKMLESGANGNNPFAATLGTLSAIAGGVAFAGSDQFLGQVQSILDASSAGTEVFAGLAGSITRMGKTIDPELMGTLGGIFGAASSAVGTIQALQEGEYFDAAVGGANTLVGVLALAGVPGMNVAGLAIAAGVMGYQIYQDVQQKHAADVDIRQTMRDIGIPEGEIALMMDGVEGGYEALTKDQGIDEKAIADFAAEGGPWASAIGSIAAGPNGKQLLAALAGPDGKQLAMLKDLTAGLTEQQTQIVAGWVQILAQEPGIKSPLEMRMRLAEIANPAMMNDWALQGPMDKLMAALGR